MLILNDNNFLGSIPSEIFSNLPNVTMIGMGNNKLTGPIPNELAPQAKLYRLYFLVL